MIFLILSTQQKSSSIILSTTNSFLTLFAGGPSVVLQWPFSDPSAVLGFRVAMRSQGTQKDAKMRELRAMNNESLKLQR